MVVMVMVIMLRRPDDVGARDDGARPLLRKDVDVRMAMARRGEMVGDGRDGRYGLGLVESAAVCALMVVIATDFG